MAGNTTVMHGKTARCAYGTAGSGTNIDYITGWTVTVNLETSEFGRQGQHWKEQAVGQAGWTASLTGELLLSNTQQAAIFSNLVTATPGTKLTGATALAFHGEDAGDHYSGDSYVTGLTINSQLGSIVNFTINVVGTGALTQTIAA